MAEQFSDTIQDLSRIDKSDIRGLWDVIRIKRINETPVYPWINKRFKFNFLEEMLFMGLKDGLNFHGTWELSERIFETRERYSIILNGTFEYVIINIDENEMTLSDQTNEYLLVRRL